MNLGDIPHTWLSDDTMRQLVKRVGRMNDEARRLTHIGLQVVITETDVHVQAKDLLSDWIERAVLPRASAEDLADENDLVDSILAQASVVYNRVLTFRCMMAR